MSILDTLRDAAQKAHEGTPAYDALMLMLLKALELGPQNDGLLFTYMREARDAINTVIQAVETPGEQQ